MKRSLPDILTPDEEHLLLKQFNRRYPTSYRNRTMIELALSTGMRIGDLIGLKWPDVELDTGRTHVKQGKGKKDRVIFIKPSMLDEMLSQCVLLSYGVATHAPVGLVFKTLDGKPVQSQYLRRMIGEKADKAGITKRVYFHLLRHTYLTRLYGRTKDIRVVQEVAGHADISTTMIYTHVSGEDVRKAMLEEVTQ